MTAKQQTQSPTAQYFERAISFSTATQREIAKQAGFPMPNTISMMKSGQMKVPIERIPALAKAMGVDPSDFLVSALMEYHPEVWEVLKQTLGIHINSAEKDIIILYRLANSKGNIQLNEEAADLLLSLFTMLAKKG